MGSDADQTRLREGTITANLTKSEKCVEFLKEKTTDILNFNFVKEYVGVSFMIEKAEGREKDVKDMLREQLEKAFNSVSGFEKISFIQLVEVNATSIKNNTKGDTELHLIDFQILLKHGGEIKYNSSLEDSVIQGLAIAARITARVLHIVHTAIYYPHSFPEERPKG